MATDLDASTDVVLLKRFSDIQHDEVAECYAVLSRKDAGRTKKDEPYWTCYFRDKRAERQSPVWSNNRFFREATAWSVGDAFRMKVRGSLHPRYGLQVELLAIRPVDPALDAADGFDFYDLVPSGFRDPCECWDRIHECVATKVPDPHVRQLLAAMLAEHREAVMRFQAATNMHHAYTGGLIEHVWSMTRIAVFLGDHYERYYPTLNPPLNRSVIIAAAILHDIGKIREMAYNPVAAQYTTAGKLIGHIVFGRDMVREAAARIEGFPVETLMLLEHAILAHHGRTEFGSPVVPQTIEALIVSFVDELDAKVNQVAGKLLTAEGEDTFTDKVYGLDNRKFYRGIPLPGPGPDEPMP